MNELEKTMRAYGSHAGSYRIPHPALSSLSDSCRCAECTVYDRKFEAESMKLLLAWRDSSVGIDPIVTKGLDDYIQSRAVKQTYNLDEAQVYNPNEDKSYGAEDRKSVV